MIPTQESKDMEKGIDQLLGFIPYPDYPITSTCEHDSDGYNYADEGIMKKIFRCEKCGTYYEEY